MAVSDYSTTPGNNTTISGITVSDSTVVNQLDNIIRQMMADIKSADDANVKTSTIGSAVQAYDADLAAIAGLTSAANKLVYYTGAGTAALTDISAFGRSLIGAANAAAAGAILGPAGAISAFAMNTPPTGWLKADGSAVSRTTYATLFAAIGTTFGVGDGSTTFNLPDLRGEFVRGWDDGKGTDSGRAFGSAQDGELEAHTHVQTVSGYDQDRAFEVGNEVSGTSVSRSDTAALSSTQSTGGTETRPRNIALLYCIKT